MLIVRSTAPGRQSYFQVRHTVYGLLPSLLSLLDGTQCQGSLPQLSFPHGKDSSQSLQTSSHFFWTTSTNKPLLKCKIRRKFFFPKKILGTRALWLEVLLQH